jgi:hypothetical protein
LRDSGHDLSDNPVALLSIETIYLLSADLLLSSAPNREMIGRKTGPPVGRTTPQIQGVRNKRIDSVLNPLLKALGLMAAYY